MMNEAKNEGKIKILEMLQEGKITVEQSLELLAQFPDEKKAGRRMDPRQINPNKRRDEDNDSENYDDWEWGSDWDEAEDEDGYDFSNLGQRIKAEIEGALGTDLSSIGNDIKQSIRDIGRDLEDADIHLDMSGLFGNYKHRSTVTYISDPVPQAINQLKLIGKNAKVEIRGYDGDRLRITCKYNPKRQDAQIIVNEAGGSYEVLYDYNAMRSVAIYAEVPRVFVESIHGETKNAMVGLDGIKCRHAHLLTKNASIRVENSDCKEIAARTRNAAIKAEKLTADNIDFETSNSKIDVDDTTAQTARLTTSNSKVTTEHCDIKQLFIKTTNAGIKMERLFKYSAAQSQWDAEHIIEAHTTNGGVSIYVPRDVAAVIQASTSNGRVDCELPNMLMGEISKNYISGRNRDYDNAAKKVKINVSTTNSTIKFKEE
ncbi:MAG: DUF4097 domain-containing protein [Clostridiales bacterium]|jgi:hypothetical protein|nr:DUF4097 domain-containing protein [Clostridiales bacterium]